MKEKTVTELGEYIENEISKLKGYCLIIYPHLHFGMINYCSNINKQDLITLLEKTLDELKNGKKCIFK